MNPPILLTPTPQAEALRIAAKLDSPKLKKLTGRIRQWKN